MPYLPQAIKDTIELPYVRDDGQLTYVIDRMAEELLAEKCGYDWDNLSYSMIAQIVGDIDCAKFEFQRRILALYEDRKIIENGDVFEAPAVLGRALVDAVLERRSTGQKVADAESVA